jgi:SAM-dependent methyltransferase
MHDESIRQYDGLSENYHWLYSDNVLSGALALRGYEAVLRSAGPKARILDCSCGVGTLTISLAKRGFEVSGSDASQGMVEQAVLASKNAGLDIPLNCCTWEELPNRFADPFDLIFCLGNSIGHARGGDAMLRSLQGMRAVLKPGGKLVIDSRDWEQLRKEKIRFTPYPQWRERAGQRCLPLYIWNFPERFEDAHTIEVVLLFDSGGNVSLRSYPIVYYPFRFDELVERLRCAGFSAIDRSSERDGEYRVIAS